ncbi:hypothetical protein D5086_031285 [Populus alba]|uniref:Uncharacterized protein n=1 Tax=Populus alba TaxID=43335 RepID=A0ACC4AQV5_POPAL
MGVDCKGCVSWVAEGCACDSCEWDSRSMAGGAGGACDGLAGGVCGGSCESASSDCNSRSKAGEEGDLFDEGKAKRDLKCLSQASSDLIARTV